MIQKRGVWFYHCSILVVLCILPSCIKQNIAKHNKKDAIQSAIDYGNNAILDTIVYQEAMLVTIPIPLYNTRILPPSLEFCEKETISLGYNSPLSVECAID